MKLFLFIPIFVSSLGLASENQAFESQKKSSSVVPDVNDSNDINENLPDIEAQTYNLQILRRSNSNKIYLLDDVTNRQPKVGRILLFKKEDQPIMAFRVLRTYSDKKTVAAKRIKRYGNTRNLEDGETYLAIEKISDVTPPPPTDQDRADLNELETKQGLKVLPYDEELDGPTSPHSPRSDGTHDTSEKDDEQQEIQTTLAVEEPRLFDHNLHWLTAGFGYIKNNGSPATGGGSYYFSSGNLRYGVSLGRMVFLEQAHLQDSIVVETGIYLYKGLNFAAQGDAYTIVSIPLTLRYNILFSESFGIFISAGIIQSKVLASIGSNASVVSSLSSTLPSAGGGFLFQVGPGWYTRVDIGIDSIGLNLLLRF